MTWVGVALAVYGAYEGNRSRRAGVRDQRRAQAEDQKLLDEQRQRQAKFDQMAQPWLQSGQQNLGLAEQYLRQLASGDRNVTMQALAPNINNMLEQSRGAVAVQRNLMPRGGMQAAAGAQIPQQLQGGINNLMFGARSDAMNSLGQLGQNQTSLGLGAMGQGAGLTNSMLEYGLNARQQQFNQGMQAGQGMAGTLAALGQAWNTGYGAWTNRGKSAGTDPAAANPYMPSNQLANFGQGRTLGFGGRAPLPATQPNATTQSGQGSTYSLYNPYGSKP